LKAGDFFQTKKMVLLR